MGKTEAEQETDYRAGGVAAAIDPSLPVGSVTIEAGKRGGEGGGEEGGEGHGEGEGGGGSEWGGEGGLKVPRRLMVIERLVFARVIRMQQKVSSPNSSPSPA